MAAIKLTKTAMERLRAPHPSGKQTLVWDSELKGFGVLLSGRTTARTFIVQRRLPDGRERRVTIRSVAEWEAGDTTLEEIRAEAAKRLVDLRAGRDPKEERRKGMTLRSALEKYLDEKTKLRPKSREDMRKTVERYLSGWMDTPLSQITSEMVMKRHREIKDEITTRERARQEVANKRNQSRSKPLRRAQPPQGEHAIKRTGHFAADGAMVALRALWNYANNPEDGDPLLQNMVNPVDVLKRKESWFRSSKDVRERRIHSEQLPTFYNSVRELESTTARDYILLLLFTGLRREEAASLLWDDVDLAERIIRIRRVRAKSGRKLDLPMSDLVRDLLVARRAVGKEEYVFPAESEKGYIAEPRYPLGEIAKATGIYVSAHDLRRTYMGIAHATDISAYALKGLVNHSAGNDVTAGYIGLTTADLREPVQRVADRIKELCNIKLPASINVKTLRQ